MTESRSWKTFEGEVFRVLEDAFTRQECAARAAARLERLVVDRYEEEQQEPVAAGEGEAVTRSAGSSASREFSADQFLELFTSTNLLKLVRELLDVMEMTELEEELTTHLIRESFRNDGAKGRAREGEQFIGTDADLALHNMREAAARAQRTRNGG